MTELHAPGADPDLAGRAGDQADHDGGVGAGHPGIEVVLGEPVAVVAEPFGVLGQVDRVADGVGRRLP